MCEERRGCDWTQDVEIGRRGRRDRTCDEQRHIPVARDPQGADAQDRLLIGGGHLTYPERSEDHHPGCAGTQSEERGSRRAAQQDGRVHRTVRLRQVITRVRYAVRGGAAPVCGVVVRVCASVPRANGQAGCGFHRGIEPCGVDRPEDHKPQSAFDRGHDHRDL